MIEISMIHVFIGLAICGLIICILNEIFWWNEGIIVLGLVLLIFGLFGSMVYYETDIFKHLNECQCTICYEQIGNIDGIDIYRDRQDNLNYLDKTNKKYEIIYEEDNTPYTYDEYRQYVIDQIQQKEN